MEGAISCVDFGKMTGPFKHLKFKNNIKPKKVFAIAGLEGRAYEKSLLGFWF